MYWTELPTLDNLFDLAEMGRRAMLRANLHHTTTLASGLNHGTPLPDGICQGLFHIHIFARIARQYRGNRMPVIGRRNKNCIYILLFKKLSEIVVNLAAGPR